MTTRVEIQHGGELTTNNLPSTGGVSSSADYVPQGVTVQSTIGLGGSRTVTDQAQIADSDLVEIDGMQITAKMARELGLMNKVFDEGLSFGAAARAAAEHQENAAKPEEQPEAYGHEDFDSATTELNTKIEAGDMGYDEAVEYHTAVGEIALADMSVADVMEAVEGFRDGTVGAVDMDANQRSIVESVEAKVTATATASAKAELGDEGFSRLSEIAKGNPEVSSAIRQYAALRVQGQADVSWTEFLEDAEEHVRGVRYDD